MNTERKINIMLGILFVSMIVIIIVIALDPTKKPNQFEYNGFVVSRFRLPSAPDVVFHSIDLYVGDDKYNIPIRSNPLDIESIKVSGLEDVSWLTEIEESNNYDVLARTVYLTFDPNKLKGGDLIIAGGEIIRVLGTGNGGIYRKQVFGAFTNPLENNASPVIKDCQDATLDTGIIRLQLGEENRVFTEGNCIIIEATNYENLIKAADKFLLTLLGVSK